LRSELPVNPAADAILADPAGKLAVIIQQERGRALLDLDARLDPAASLLSGTPKTRKLCPVFWKVTVYTARALVLL